MYLKNYGQGLSVFDVVSLQDDDLIANDMINSSIDAYIV
jgi:hypothetical protein